MRAGFLMRPGQETRSIESSKYRPKRARGIFAGVDLSGAKISQDRDETRILYGKVVPFATILNGKVDPTSGSEPFLAAVREYSAQAREQGSLTSPESTYRRLNRL